MRFSLLSLLLFSLFAGVDAGALVRPHWIWSAALSTVVLLLLCAAVVCAWALPRDSRLKYFSTGFLLVAAIYLLVAHPQ